MVLMLCAFDNWIIIVVAHPPPPPAWHAGMILCAVSLPQQSLSRLTGEAGG